MRDHWNFFFLTHTHTQVRMDMSSDQVICKSLLDSYDDPKLGGGVRESISRRTLKDICDPTTGCLGSLESCARYAVCVCSRESCEHTSWQLVNLSICQKINTPRSHSPVSPVSQSHRLTVSPSHPLHTRIVCECVCKQYR